MFGIQKKENIMSANPDLKFDSDSRVALDLFRMYLTSQSQEEKKELFRDTDKLLKTFVSFLNAVKYCLIPQDKDK